MRVPRIARHSWLAAGAGAAVLWALIWFLCTVENSNRLYEWGSPDPASGDTPAGHSPFWTNGKQLSYWMSFWVRDQDENERLSLVLWVQPDDQAAVLVQILLTVLVFAACLLWATQVMPATRRSWPLTLVTCWGLSIASALVGAAVAALLRDTEVHQSRGELLSLFTGAGGPVPAVFGLFAAAVATAVAALAKPRPDPAPPRHTAGERADGSGDDAPGRALAWAGAATAAVPALVLLLSHGRVVAWLLGDPGAPDGTRVPFWVVNLVIPGFWHWEGTAVWGPVWMYALLTITGQAAVAGGLCWLVFRRLTRHRLPDFLLAGASSGILACLLVRPLGTFATGPEPEPALTAGTAGFMFAPGAFLTGLVAGYAAHLVFRRLHGTRGAAPGGADPQGEPADLLIDLTRR